MPVFCKLWSVSHAANHIKRKKNFVEMPGDILIRFASSSGSNNKRITLFVRFV